MTDQARLTWALVLSVLLHGMLLTLLPLVRRAHIELPRPSLLDVDVVQLPKAQPPPPPAAAAPQADAAPAAPAIPVPKQQIVSQPDEGEEQEPENPRFLSDRNNTVREEAVHRGEPLPGSPESKHKVPPQQVASAKAERETVERKVPAEHPSASASHAALPKLDQLLPAAGDLIREGVVQPQEPAAPPQQEASNQRTDLLRHGDPWRGAGRGGTLDFLPAVRAGDVTLLNTKAEQFAPFVRRVAMRVFENFIIALRRSVYGGLQGAVRESATIEAVMDKQGNLLAINVKDRSVSIALATDRILQAACRDGFFDLNPPPGAESSDGKIHFLFDARVDVSVDPSGRGPVGGVRLGAGLL